MSTLERAITLAAAAHAGQQDKAGAPDILHPLRMMLRVGTAAQRIAAVLHDVVEDTPHTLDDVRQMGFSEEVVAAVDALTKRSDEDYFAFVARAASNDVARPVKLADIEDNMDLSRIAEPTDRDRARIQRYRRAKKLIEAIGRGRGDRGLAAPVILPLRSRVTAPEIEEECPGKGPIYAADFYVEGAESGEPSFGGLKVGRILNVDHHAPIAAMAAPITSTILAVQFLDTYGRVESNARVVINHTDCDSVLSSAVLMGLVPDNEEMERASLYADHTGDEHPIADLLQALDETREGDRTEEQYLESLRNLKLLLNGEPLESAAEQAVAARRAKRATAKQLVETARVRQVGPLAFGTFDEEIDGAFFPPLLPKSAVIMLASRHPWNPGHWVVKLRLGAAAPEGLTLQTLGISGFDPAFGGRWNAGSNKRGGGTPMSPRDYSLELLQRLNDRLADPSADPVILQLQDAVEQPQPSSQSIARLRYWAPGLYGHKGEEYEVDGMPGGGLSGYHSDGTPVDPVWVMTRGRHVPLTADVALRWLVGPWELKGTIWEIGMDPVTSQLRAWCATLELYGSPYLVIGHGRKLTRAEAAGLAPKTWQ